MSDTPRTDAQDKRWTFADDPYGEMVKFARQLERELNASRPEEQRMKERYLWLVGSYLYPALRHIDRAHELPNGGYVFYNISSVGPRLLGYGETMVEAIDAAMAKSPLPMNVGGK